MKQYEEKLRKVIVSYDTESKESYFNFIIDSLAIDEAKRIFQGGEQFIPTKHGVAKRMVFNSGIYITCNEVKLFLST